MSFPNVEIPKSDFTIPITRLPYSFEPFKVKKTDCRDRKLRKVFESLGDPSSLEAGFPLTAENIRDTLQQYSFAVTVQQARHLLVLMDPKHVGLVLLLCTCLCLTKQIVWEHFQDVMLEYMATHKKNYFPLTTHVRSATSTNRPYTAPPPS